MGTLASLGAAADAGIGGASFEDASIVAGKVGQEEIRDPGNWLPLPGIPGGNAADPLWPAIEAAIHFVMQEGMKKVNVSP